MLQSAYTKLKVTGTGRSRASSVLVTKKMMAEICKKQWLLALSAPYESQQSSSLEMVSSVPGITNLNKEISVEVEGLDAGIVTLDAATSSLNGIPIRPGSTCVLGVDPDVWGALAVLRTDGVTTAKVFDAPNVEIMVGKTKRRRHDTRSIAELINQVKAPYGTVAYIEQSAPFPKDGKQGWWGSGFGFGIWTGVLVASGLSVIPVPSSVWKRAMGFSKTTGDKDNCRAVASLLFPSLSSQLQRKKDHGRAEALLIAAFGKGILAPIQESQ
eukprot:c21961_g1_i1 orf=393-1202(-)